MMLCETDSDGVKITKYVSETILPDLLKNMSILGESEH